MSVKNPEIALESDSKRRAVCAEAQALRFAAEAGLSRRPFPLASAASISEG